MKPTPPSAPEDPIRPHVFDGIAEYDKRLPNWWLYTLYITIIFWIVYWGHYEWFHNGRSSQEEVDLALKEIEIARLSTAKIDDEGLWKMSRNPVFVEAGKALYASNCAACHLASLRGKSENPAAIGPDLTDTVWIHGGNPTEVHSVISQGVIAKGMPTWGPVLGSKKITEIAAFLLSLHQPGEPIVRDPATPAVP